jgi:hypothetical protein
MKQKGLINKQRNLVRVKHPAHPILDPKNVVIYGINWGIESALAENKASGINAREVHRTRGLKL